MQSLLTETVSGNLNSFLSILASSWTWLAPVNGGRPTVYAVVRNRRSTLSCYDKLQQCAPFQTKSCPQTKDQPWRRTSGTLEFQGPNTSDVSFSPVVIVTSYGSLFVPYTKVIRTAFQQALRSRDDGQIQNLQFSTAQLSSLPSIAGFEASNRDG